MGGEGRRVLKDDGVLAFSFHHSRAEGWAAIYEAIVRAGLFVVAAHPVHAELRAASPKTAAKDPISLDAILVCRKQPKKAREAETDRDFMRDVENDARRLETAGMAISGADRFVIGASKLLISASSELLDFEGIKARLEDLRIRLKVPENGQDQV